MADPIWPPYIKPKPKPPAPPPSVQDRLNDVAQAVQKIDTTLDGAKEVLEALTDQVKKAVDLERTGESAFSEVATTALATVQEAAAALARNTEAMQGMVPPSPWSRIDIEVVGRDGAGLIKRIELRRVA